MKTKEVSTLNIGHAREISDLNINEVGELLRTSMIISRIATADQSLYIAYAHMYHFKKPDQWLAWCTEITGYARRTVYMMSAIGKMFWELPPAYYERHKTTDITKLEIVAGLPPHRQLDILKDDAIKNMTREAVRALVLCSATRQTQEIDKKKTEFEQMEFSDLLGGLSRITFEDDNAVIEKAKQISPSVIFGGGYNAIMLIEAAVRLRRFDGISEKERGILANELRIIAEQLDESCVDEAAIDLLKKGA